MQLAAAHPLGLMFGTIGGAALGALIGLAAGPVGRLIGAVGGAVPRLVLCMEWGIDRSRRGRRRSVQRGLK